MKKTLSILLALVMLCGLLPTAAMASEVEAENPAQINDNLLRLWYTKPATDWETQALAIGNGYMGGLVFGDVGKDKIHINEKTMWNGYPGTFGNTNPTGTEEDLEKIKSDLNYIREKLDDKSENLFGFASTGGGIHLSGEAMQQLNKLMGDLRGYSSPWDYTNIYLNFSRAGHANNNVENYVRDLDMRTALATTSYDYDGVHYTREYFNSHPDNVLVIRLEADQDAKLTFDVQYGRNPSAEGDTITDSGSYGNNGNTYYGELKVVNEGGEVTAEGTKLCVTGANTVTLYLAVGTDYVMEYPTFRGEAPKEAVQARIATAVEKGYEQVKEDHVADHSELFGRLELGLGEEIPQIPTDELIDKYNNMVDGDGSNTPTVAEQRALEVMCYQFGRYLTIAGSRPGSLPTNLQGVWGEGSFAWGGDYHFNINIQMNYWPTMASNLDECLLPYIDYLNVLKVAGRQGAASAFGIKSEEGEENGWLVGCFSTPYMYACMGQKGNATGWNPAGSAWALQNAYEYYLYTGDVDYLRDNLYPSMKEVANFWNEALWWSEYQQRYVSGPSYSPENGPIANGVSYDQQLIWEHFNNTIHAAEILGVDEDLIPAWRDKQSKLDPVIVGDSGQVKEWFEETSIGRAQAGDLPEGPIPGWRDSLGAGDVPHRHISHLMAMYPGTLINKDNDEFMDAAMVTLEERGLDGSGWSKGHKINLWARTGNGEKTFELIRSAVGGGNSGFLHNLFSSHGGGTNYKGYPIFQIDGNYGYTAGVNEMLIQSQLGYTQFLPAIPEEWNTGFVHGIMARGNFEIGMDWTDGTADKFTILSNNGGTFTGEYANLAGYTVTDSEGNPVATTALTKDKVSFETKAGETYTINFDSADPLSVQKKVADVLVGSMTDSRLAVAKEVLEKAAAEATDADVLAAANATASRAMEFLRDIDDAKAFYNDNLESASEGIQVDNALKELLAEITKAEALLDDAASTKETFEAQADALDAAMKNVTEIGNNFGTFVKKIEEAEAFRSEQDFAEEWVTAIAALQELTDAIDEANALKTQATTSADDIAASMTRMSNAMKAITNLIDSLGVEIRYEDGVLTLIPSDTSFDIRYTLDGNQPSLISRIYSEPLTLNKKAVTVYAQLYLGEEPYGEASFYSKGGGNVALNKPTSSNSYNWGGYGTEKAVDGDRVSRWAPYSVYANLTIDLGDVIEINGGAVYESAYPGRVECYELQVSLDNANWTTVAHKTEMGESSWEPVEARYVRYVTMEANSTPNIGEIEIYAVPDAEGDPTDFTVLNQTLADAEKVLNGVYQNVDAAAQAEFDKWLDIARAVAANENSDQYTVDAAEVALRNAINALAVTVDLKGETKITVDDEALTYTVAVSNTSGLATATIDMTIDGNVADLEVNALNDWYIIAQTYSNGKLSVVMGNNAGVTGQEGVEILSITVKTTGQRGKVTASIDSAVLSSFVGEAGEAFVDAILGNATVETEITYSVYDVNQDGSVDQLDITRAQRSYGASDGDDNWIARADVNRDGTVDINDLILILNNYSKK